jgi:cell pole-organizing protein PopZ
MQAPAPEPLRVSDGALTDALLSSTAGASVGQAFNLLSHTVLTQNARTLEDLVKEMLKPMLKIWLDDNLPPLVERLVRAEIERVARGRN